MKAQVQGSVTPLRAIIPLPLRDPHASHQKASSLPSRDWELGAWAVGGKPQSGDEGDGATKRVHLGFLTITETMPLRTYKYALPSFYPQDDVQTHNFEGWECVSNSRAPT